MRKENVPEGLRSAELSRVYIVTRSPGHQVSKDLSRWWRWLSSVEGGGGAVEVTDGDDHPAGRGFIG
jgi:hypothetical protein